MSGGGGGGSMGALRGAGDFVGTTPAGGANDAVTGTCCAWRGAVAGAGGALWGQLAGRRFGVGRRGVAVAWAESRCWALVWRPGESARELANRQAAAL
jgi:hypothetical protein